jgi:hypothetical protein
MAPAVPNGPPSRFSRAATFFRFVSGAAFGMVADWCVNKYTLTSCQWEPFTWVGRLGLSQPNPALNFPRGRPRGKVRAGYGMLSVDSPSVLFASS